MKLNLSIPEIEEFIKSYFKISMSVAYVDRNTIQVEYVIPLKLTIERVERHSILLKYELSWAANLLAKGAKFMVNNKLDDKILNWDTKNQTLSINLLYVDAIRDFLVIFQIHKFEIIENEVLVELTTTDSK